MEKANYIIEWILAGISFFSSIASIVSWLKAKMHSNEAKAEAKKAKEYLDNADEANLAAKKYYEQAIETMNLNRKTIENQQQKEKIHKYILMNGLCKTEKIAEIMSMSQEEAFCILEEMCKVDHSISAAGRVRLDNLKVLTWTPNSK